MRNAFCILAAGKGSRLGDLTSSVNKGLLPIANMAAITYIIEKVPKDCDIVVAVGYDKEKLIEYCEAAHPDRKFEFVEVGRLEGPGSGPGFSLLCCEYLLQRPFYLCNVDTIITEDEYPILDCDWLGVSYTLNPSAFATVERQTNTGVMTALRDKGFRTKGSAFAYTGLAGVLDYALFWKKLRDGYRIDEEFQYTEAFKSNGESNIVHTKSLDWLDTGSIEGYHETCSYYEGFEKLGMEKNINEITYRVGDRLIKLCWEASKNYKRIHRAKQLAPNVPEIVYAGKYVMAYLWVQGITLYGCRDLGVWLRFFNWCTANIWNVRYPGVFTGTGLMHSFYYDKTWERLRQYHTAKGWDECPALTINGYPCEKIESYLACLDWNNLYQGRPGRIHGDLQFDNVVLSSEGKFVLIDWRECFGDVIDYGDIYYDLAKIYSGLDLPYDVLKRKEITIEAGGTAVKYSFSIDSTISACKSMFESWIQSSNYDLQKVRILAALIHLNMSPLHPAPIGDLLFYHAQLRLAQMYDWSSQV